jgi:hypothetical protein
MELGTCRCTKTDSTHPSAASEGLFAGICGDLDQCCGRDGKAHSGTLSCWRLFINLTGAFCQQGKFSEVVGRRSQLGRR